MPLINLDFNLEDVKSSFEPLPTAQYLCKLVKQELKTSQSGKSMIAIEWNIAEGEHTGRKVFDNVVLSVDWKVKQYAELIGVESGKSIDPELFVGVEAVLDILCREQTEKEKNDARSRGYDPDVMKNEIKKITKVG